MKRIILAAVGLAVIVGAGTYWVLMESDPAAAPVSQQSESVPANESSEASEPVEPAPATEEATLAAVGGYSGDGQATRTIEGEYIHTVTANIGEPAAGKFYEGWIVVDANDFISTGRLTEESPGQWSLTYSSKEDLVAYKSVVITEETEANGLDNVPEAHVLEGSF